MLDEITFCRHAEIALAALKRALIQAESDAEFEVEEHNGSLHIHIEEPLFTFVLAPHAQVRQIWISAALTSLQLDWDEPTQSFVLLRTGEPLQTLVGRLITEHLGGSEILPG